MENQSQVVRRLSITVSEPGNCSSVLKADVKSNAQVQNVGAYKRLCAVEWLQANVFLDAFTASATLWKLRRKISMTDTLRFFCR